jgi:TIR domain
MPRVFISHSSKDREPVERRIVALLEHHGIETWYSRDAIHASQYWERQIKRGLETCDWFLVALSAQALTSEWVGAEVNWALENRKGRVVPVLLQPCDPTQLNLKLSLIQHLDFTNDTVAARQALLAIWGIRREPNNELQLHPDAISAPPQVEIFDPIRRRRWFATLILAILTLTGLAAYLAVREAPSPGAPNVRTDHTESPEKADRGPRRPEASAPVQIAVSLNPLFPNGGIEHVSIPPDRQVSYQEFINDGVLQVNYRLPYLDLYARGGPVAGVPSEARIGWNYPALAIKVVNQTRQTVMCTHAILEVTESRENQEPLLMVVEGPNSSLEIINEGWGEVIDPVIHLTIPSTMPSADRNRPPVERRSLKIPSFTERTVAPIASFIPDQLANAAVNFVEGEIEYGPPNQRTSVAFRTRINLPPMTAGYTPVSFTYDAQLEAGKNGIYRVPLSQTIKPGEADHFLLRIGSDRTARYRFQVAVIGIDGTELVRQPVELDLFVPRTARREPVSETAKEKTKSSISFETGDGLIHGRIRSWKAAPPGGDLGVER